jgi:SH3 domain-containing protein
MDRKALIALLYRESVISVSSAINSVSAGRRPMRSFVSVKTISSVKPLHSVKPLSSVKPPYKVKPLRWLLLVVFSLFSFTLQAKDAEAIRVQVADPFIEVHTGPGRGYPIFHVVEQDAWIQVIKRRTQWIKVQTPRGRTGWVYRDQLARTLDETGEYVALDDTSLEDYFRRHGELGVMVGELDGVTSLSVTAGFAFTENLQVDLSFTEAQSTLATNRLTSLDLQHHLYPRWRFSPYILMGAGIVDIEPRTVLVKPDISSNREVHAGLGLRVYLTRSFVFRAEYRNFVVLTDSNDNDELEAWRAGFGVLF